jgi:hypothetical protein
VAAAVVVLVPHVGPMVVVRAMRMVMVHRVVVRMQPVMACVQPAAIRVPVTEPVAVAGVVAVPAPAVRMPMVMGMPVTAPIVPGDRRMRAAAALRPELMRCRPRVAQGADRRGRSRGLGHGHHGGTDVYPVRRLRTRLRRREDAHLRAHDVAEAGDGQRVRRRQRDRGQDGVHRGHGGAEPARRDHPARPGDHPRPCRFPACEAHA